MAHPCHYQQPWDREGPFVAGIAVDNRIAVDRNSRRKDRRGILCLDQRREAAYSEPSSGGPKVVDLDNTHVEEAQILVRAVEEEDCLPSLAVLRLVG